MNQSFITSELGIIIAVNDNKPTILNLDFLRYSGIVLNEWELARSPIHTNSFSQLIFANGINLIAEPNRVMFLEVIEGKEVGEIAVPSIARKYVEMLPNAEYQALGINPRGYCVFAQQQNAEKYLSETLLSPGSWQQVGNAPMRASLNLVYTLERCPFHLNINEAGLRNPDETITPIIMFNGSFSYEVNDSTAKERITHLDQVINNLQVDLSTFQEIISTKFLTKVVENTTVVPDLSVMNAVSS
jgi:hypothetical protein